ncbi:TonB-dependent receptor (plasmid) [Sphingobium sp. SJ10-10]|uniref:TonB-dependent receptor n=1 Tax=Sphingobium sp. SJ10-10 TaxID=3114999 RepID=UPI002E189A6E|nr:TonB-dependent receptor [Sphingobium sp. SJ10-10]
MISIRTIQLLAASSVAIAMAAPCFAAAEQPAPGGVEESGEITVTARKRDERTIDIPVSITAISGDALAARGTPSLHDLDRVVPSVTITNFGAGNISQAAVAIRGIVTNDHRITTDPAVSIYVDGVYIARNMGINFNLTNLDHVEILRGPQGTLSGRNSIGGAINLVTKQPDQNEHYEMGAQIGTRGRANFDFYGNFPVTDTLAMSLSGDIEHRNGIGTFINVPSTSTKVGQIFQGSGRFSAKWTPTDRVSLLLTVDGFRGSYGITPMYNVIINPAGTSGLTAGVLPVNRNDNGTANPSIPDTNARTFGVSLVGIYKLDDHLSLKAIGAERYLSYKGGLDDDNSPLSIAESPETGDSRQWTGELQLNGEYGRFDFVSGLFYFHESGGARVQYGASGSLSGGTIVTNRTFSGVHQISDSYAAYLHGGYELADGLKISAGARYTRDEKAMSFFRQIGAASPLISANGKSSWEKLTWDAAINYSFTPRLVSYLTVQRGYQSGGFPSRPSSVAAFVPYNPTIATSYEGGLKGSIGRAFNFSTAVFYTQYRDLVLAFNQFVGGSTGFVSIQANAGRSRTYGAEFEGHLAVGRGFNLDGSVGYNNALVTYVTPGTQATAAGNRPPNTPQWTASLGPSFRTELANGNEVAMRVDGSYRSAFFSQPLNTVYNRIAPRFLANFDLSYSIKDKQIQLSIYGNNIFNKVYDVNRVDSFKAGYLEILTNNDRSEFGMKVRKKF